METPSYIQSLLTPNGRKPAGRRVWSILLETVWLPFFTATNTVGDTHIPHDALGAPLRLSYNPDGTVKFSKTGRPVIKVEKGIADTIKMVRENFAAGLQQFAGQVMADHEDDYRTQVELAQQAGEPIQTKDNANLDRALVQAMADSVSEAGKGKKPVKVEEKETVTA